jgi:hypothetical protein
MAADEYEEDVEEPTPPKKKAEPVINVRRPEKKEENTEENTLVNDAGIKGVFPKIGESVDDFDIRSGDLHITEIQMPDVKNVKDGEEVTLLVKAVKTSGRYEQDSEYDDLQRKRLVTSEPYLCAKFEIVSIALQGSGDNDGEQSV